MNVVIIGTGYVGLTTGVALAYVGHKVTGVDKDPAKLALLREGKSPIHEQGVDELISHAWRNLSFTDDTAAAVANADIVIIAVGTPCRDDGAADTSFVESAAKEVAAGVEPDREYVLVVKSTVPIGSNQRVRRVVERVLEERDVTTNVYFASNPEFLREGKAVSDMLYPDRIVVGSDDELAIERMRRLYEPILEQTFTPLPELPRTDLTTLPNFVTTDATSAEMIKYAANAFLAVKISYMNEIAGLCDRVGAEVTEVARGIGLDPRIGHRFLQAGLGWGGSCFPKDTAALISLGSEYDYTMPILEGARTVNHRQRRAIVEKLQSALKVVRGRTVGILGLAFKPDTDDVREAPAMDIIRSLVDLGANVRVHDPIAMDNARQLLAGQDVDFMDEPYAVARNADALVLATEWEAYTALDLYRLAEGMNQPVLVDGRNLFVPDDARAAGFQYIGIGR